VDKRANFHSPARDAEIEEEEPVAMASSPPLASPRPAPASSAPAARPAMPESSRIEIEPTEIFERILKRPS
jgi:hypothetical protein